MLLCLLSRGKNKKCTFAGLLGSEWWSSLHLWYVALADGTAYLQTTEADRRTHFIQQKKMHHLWKYAAALQSFFYYKTKLKLKTFKYRRHLYVHTFLWHTKRTNFQQTLTLNRWTFERLGDLVPGLRHLSILSDREKKLIIFWSPTHISATTTNK